MLWLLDNFAHCEKNLSYSAHYLCRVWISLHDHTEADCQCLGAHLLTFAFRGNMQHEADLNHCILVLI